jgi:triacylglycerol esterase/lipase EstA (alpha/beta hydrolase family)
LRPLVFIGHSIGGLVVKQALVEARLNPQYTWVAEATTLLVFFATPHQGGNYSEVGSVAAAFARTLSRKPSDDLLNALQKNSAEASRRYEQARHLPKKCLVISFYEKLSYGKLKIVSLTGTLTVSAYSN